MYLIQEAARISGISVRTLHHYDQIGLLVPKRAKNGYRYYSDEDLDTLQSILFYRQLKFSLEEICGLLESAKEDRLGMLESQLLLLQHEQSQLNTLVNTLKKTISAYKGETTMSVEEKFQGFSWKDNAKYESEARKLYGNEVIDESRHRQKGREEETAAAFNKVFCAFATNLAADIPAASEENLQLANQLFEYINTYVFDCSPEVFGCIGASYSANPEFKKNIDKFGEGTAQYASDAIAAFIAL